LPIHGLKVRDLDKHELFSKIN